MKDELKVLISPETLKTLYEFKEAKKPTKSLSVIVENALKFYFIEMGFKGG